MKLSEFLFSELFNKLLTLLKLKFKISDFSFQSIVLFSS
jgi:hypothetical protein